MALQAGPNYFIGRIGNLIYYKSKGKFYVKQAPLSDRKLSKKEKEWRKLNEGMIEFAGASVLAKAFRDTFAGCLSSFKDQFLNGRLTGIFSKMIKQGSGKTGMRKAEFLKNGNAIVGFEFHKNYIFDQIFHPAIKWEVKKGGKEIEMVVDDFSSRNVSKPEGATHFRIILNAGVLSDHSYSKAKDKYLPVKSTFNKRSVEAGSEPIPLKKSPKEIHIPVRFPSEVPASCAIVVCAMIEFYKEENGELYGLTTNRAMRIVEVL